MMIEPFMAATGVLGGTSIMLFALWRDSESRFKRAQRRWSAQLDELTQLRLREEDRKYRLSQAGKAGRKAQIARAAETSAQRLIERERAKEQTLAAVASTPMRSRAQVVAPVKAKRTRAKKSAAGVAAKTGG